MIGSVRKGNYSRPKEWVKVEKENWWDWFSSVDGENESSSFFAVQSLEPHNLPRTISGNQHQPMFPHNRPTKPITPRSNLCFILRGTIQEHGNPSHPEFATFSSCWISNADIYVEIDRLPKEGKTVSAKSGQTFAGGKGANQAACGGKLSYPTYFMGQVGEDAHGSLIRKALESGGVNLGYCSLIDGVPTGHAVVMLQSDGQNSIVIVGGANMSGWPEVLPDEDLEFVKSAGIVLLQREIPDSVNIQVAKASVAFMLNFYLFSGRLLA